MKESSNMMLNEPSKIQYNQSQQRKKSVLEHKKFDKDLDNTFKRKTYRWILFNNRAYNSRLCNIEEYWKKNNR